MLEVIDGRDLSTPVHIPRPRPVRPDEVTAQVREIVDDVRLRGDAAVLEHTERLDNAALTPAQLAVDEQAIARARRLVRPELIDALEVMAERLRRTCDHQGAGSWIERTGDEYVGELVRPLRRIGVYAPAGEAATVIMGVVPAQVAGVEGIAVASPVGPGGEVSEPVLAACAVAGLNEVYGIGGAQAIAALAFGTATVRPVVKVVGRGNPYVTEAMRLVRGWVGVDAEAGPSELAVIADGGADPASVAADLVAQAENGPLGCHALITWVPELAEGVLAALERIVAVHERSEDVENALIEGGAAVLVRDLEHALETANALAPERLELLFEGAFDALDQVRNAGGVFVGQYTPASAGEYVAGTNHILPTRGAARWTSGLGVPNYLSRTYVCGLSHEALERLAPHIDWLSEAEGRPGHARAVDVRLDRPRS